MILISGASGFIGSNFVNSFLESSCENIILFDNFSNSSINPIINIEKKHNLKLNFYNLSLLDKASLENLFKKYLIKKIIHFAGLKSVGESAMYPGKYFYNNVIGSKIFFSLAKKYKVDNLIFSSSATVYGKPIYLPLNENHPIRSINPYGQNKIDIERLLINDPYFQSECSVKVLRYFNPIGAHTSGMFGEKPMGIPNNLMPYILNVAKGIYPELLIYGDNYSTHDGTGVRDYIHITDLVQGHINALEYSKKGVSIFNLGTGRGYSVLDLVRTFEKVNRVKIPFKFVDRRPGDVDCVYADPSLASHQLKFKTTRNLEQMCHDAWNFASRNN